MILFCDFDDTLYFANDPAKTMRNQEAIRRWKALGHQFGIATGRSYDSLKEALDPAIFELCDYLILDVGSLTYSQNGELKDGFYIDRDTIRQLRQFAESTPVIPEVTYFNVNGESADSNITDVTKVRFWFNDEAEIAVADQKLSSQPLRTFQYTTTSGNFRSHGQGYAGMLEIISEASGKENAIKNLIDSDQITASSVVTVGDGHNDFGMIRRFDGYLVPGKHHFRSQEFKRVDSLHQLITDLTA